MKRMLEKGYKRLEYELDLMDMIKNHKIHHKILKTEVLSHCKRDVLDVDEDSDFNDFKLSKNAPRQTYLKS